MSKSTNSEAVFGSDIKRLPFKDLIKRIGPGLIATGIVIGPGAVTTSAMLGANYGYALIWLIFPIIFMGITFMMVTNRLAITTGLPTIHAIRKYYGPVASAVVGIAVFMACLFFTMGNISGTGAGMNLIFGINWKIGSLIMIVIVLYCYFAKNVYSRVEKLITACILVMILSFYITLIGVGGPSEGELATGLFSFKIPEGSLATALAFISTNAAVTAGIYNTYLGKEKKWNKEDLFNGVMFTDALVHVISAVLISGAIILVGAIVLHPQGLSISAPAQLAALLVPIVGNTATYIMGIALVGAGFSSLLANTQRGMVLFGAGFNKEVGLETKFIRIGCLVCLVIAMAICYSYGGSPTQLILMANVATSIATPVGGLFILLLIWRKDINAGYKKPTALRICMTISYVFVLIMTFSTLSTQIPKLLAALGL
ncbi:metal ABC transporter [Enterocloster clostridioformis]|uniref:Nramp family divalent metal transporter n=2 Tax=Enterocloster clostridioformis TaxID=1531 RepID=UPI00080CA9D4|nr:Nramp family divalent metal transporter [Enterocloster clostridioformis]ANU45839.1 metal ABC transporter [Lachnoclostridium sp. YL32]NDO30302.1 divalent metal cation transporter [Enterocloster clostridioformis]OXE67658.1 metal ABC transporter [Enterocloster clostridioformis]QQQ99412.1 Nramp family divalent metal transporter [Enterocloster clostridioformis]